MTDRRIIGLTGGIATGKSTVSSYLSTHHGLPILDADIYAREAVEPGSEVLFHIEQRYGKTILFADGTLNRAALGKIIFSDAGERLWIEKQIHPFVRKRFSEVTDSLLNAPTLVYVIPLLFEANLTHLVTETWVVCCSHKQQKERLIGRNQLSEPEAESRIAAQMPLAEKRDRADFVLDNSSSKAALFTQVDAIL